MLFNKRSKNIIKYVWGFFATLIILTMIIAYSGFASLVDTPQAERIDIPPEVQAQLDLQKKGIDTGSTVSTPEEQDILRAIEEGRIDIGADPSTDSLEEGETRETSPPPPQELRLEI